MLYCQDMFALCKQLKKSWQGKRVGQMVEVEAHTPDRRLYPVYLLQEYVDRTRAIRMDRTNSLLVLGGALEQLAKTL